MKLSAILLILVALFLAPACSSTDQIKFAQTQLEPYSFHVDGAASGQLAFNSKYAALEGNVTAVVQFHRHGQVLWEKQFDVIGARVAYEAVFADDGKFVDVQEVDFNVALASLRPQNVPE